jgi:hypothetical protein
MSYHCIKNVLVRRRHSEYEAQFPCGLHSYIYLMLGNEKV